MSNSLCKTLLLFMLASTGMLAFADPPDRVGRLSLVQGQVDFRNTNDEGAVAATINWPITSQNVISTARGARAELRIGSTAVRLESDSELEVTQLDDQHFNLNLHFGTASVRVKNVDMVQDFQLRTPEGRIQMLEPSTIRVDADLTPDVTGITVFSGMARFEGTGSSLLVSAGKHLDIGDGNIRTTLLTYDAFDQWALARDRSDEQSISAHYVSTEITGYEDLDRSGEWRVTPTYGAIWYPYVVPAGWAPYRQGRWTWMEPWGWTWVDNAAWGYAPSHYGRWMWFERRWCWAPGRVVARPVWAPAVVGWIGGNNWNVRFSNGQSPGVGWFPLAPYEKYVPRYRTSAGYVDRVNSTATVNVLRNAADRTQADHYRNRDEHNGVTVVPHDQFTAGRTITVDAAPKVIMPPTRFPATSIIPASQPMPQPAALQRDPSRTVSNTANASAVKPATSRPPESAAALLARQRQGESAAQAAGYSPAAAARSELHHRPGPEPAAAIVAAPAREYQRRSVHQETQAAAASLAPQRDIHPQRHNGSNEPAQAVRQPAAEARHNREAVAEPGHASVEKAAPTQKTDREESHRSRNEAADSPRERFQR